MPPQTATLSTYLTELRRLLHDPSDVYFSQADKTAYINAAMQRRDRDSGGNRVLISHTLTIAQASYAFSVLSNTLVYDVVSIFLLYAGSRIRLEPLAFSALNERYRRWQNYQSTPEAWARYGPTTLYFGPTPSLAYVTEWDTCVYSTPLVGLADLDPLPYPYTDPVPYYAARMAKLNERQMDEADDFERMYQMHLLNIPQSLTGQIPVVGR